MIKKSIVGLVVCLLAIAGSAWAQSQYAGTYSGNYSGDESGKWQAVIDISGGVTGYIIDPFGGRYDGEGDANETGGFIMGVVDIGASFEGQIDNGGHVTGTWDNPYFDMTGTFSGKRIGGGDCLVNADCDNGIFCDGTETCAAGSCVDGTNPCEAGETCDEGIDECIPDVCDEEWDLDGDCDVDKDDSNLLSLRQKAEKTDLANRHKAEKAAMQAAIGSSGDCDAEMDLDGDCDVDKDDSNLLKLRQKDEKTDLSSRHKAEKAAMKAAL